MPLPNHAHHHNDDDKDPAEKKQDTCDDDGSVAPPQLTSPAKEEVASSIHAEDGEAPDPTPNNVTAHQQEHGNGTNDDAVTSELLAADALSSREEEVEADTLPRTTPTFAQQEDSTANTTTATTDTDTSQEEQHVVNAPKADETTCPDDPAAQRVNQDIYLSKGGDDSKEILILPESKGDSADAAAMALMDKNVVDTTNVAVTAEAPVVTTDNELPPPPHQVLPTDTTADETAVDETVSVETSNSPTTTANQSKTLTSYQDLAQIGLVVTPFADFQAQQRAAARERKEKERQARESKHNPATPLAPTKAASPRDAWERNPSGFVSHADFSMQQMAAAKASKRKEREARLSMHTPITSTLSPSGNTTPRSSPTNNPFALVSPMDFAAQQRAAEKARKEKERRDRASLHQLSKPAVSTSPNKPSVHNPFALVSPMDFASQQRMADKARKEKERADRASLHNPTNVVSVPNTTPKSNEDPFALVSSADFSTKQRIAEMERKANERRAREDLNKPVKCFVVGSVDRKASELKALDSEQKKKRIEAQTMAASFRHSTTTADAATLKAAELKALGNEEKNQRIAAREFMTASRPVDDAAFRVASDQKRASLERKNREKEAKEMASAYRHVGGSTDDAATRKASELKTFAGESRKKELEAKEMASAYRHVGRSTDDAATRKASELKTFAGESRKKELEAKALASSYRSSGLASGDAASLKAAELLAMKQDGAYHEQAARDLATSYRQSDMASGDAISRKAVELKALQETQRQKGKEAKEMAASYRVQDLKSSGDAAYLKAAQLAEWQQEQKTKRNEAKDWAASFRETDLTSDAASRKAAEISALKREHAQREQEAKDMAASYRMSDPSLMTATMDDASRRAAEVKLMQRERKAEEMHAIQDLEQERKARQEREKEKTAELYRSDVVMDYIERRVSALVQSIVDPEMRQAESERLRQILLTQYNKAAAAPVEELPAEEAVEVGEVPAEEAPAVGVPPVEASVEETPTEETPVETLADKLSGVDLTSDETKDDKSHED